MAIKVAVRNSAPASQVWLHAPYELHLSLFEHFIELLTESRSVSKTSLCIFTSIKLFLTIHSIKMDREFPPEVISYF